MSVLCALVFSNIGFAEPANVTIGESSQRVEQDGIVLPLLVEQAILHYPADALPLQIHGTVVVAVHLSSEGVVETVSVRSGNVLFHHEAKIAAMRLHFEPATQDNKKIPFDTTVSFHFSPPRLNETEDDGPYHSITVYSDSLHHQTAHVEEVFTEAELDKERHIDLARTLESVAGVEFASGSANSSKPLIRGQTERRLLIVQDGIPHASQKWGIDHAPEIDVFDVGTIRVRKGAEAVRYGGDAIGGVILIDSPELLAVDGVAAKTIVGGASNGLKGFGMGRVDLKQQQWVGRIQGNWMNSMDVQTPTYILGNTASNIWNLGGVTQYSSSRHVLTTRVSHHHSYSGIFYGMRSESPEDLETAFTSERPLNADEWKQGRTIEKPYQDVDHTKGNITWGYEPSWGSVEARYAYQRNDRQEAEPSRIQDAEPQYNFLLRTHSADLHVDHSDWVIGTTELDVEWGVSAKHQDNLYSGRILIPNYRQFDVGAFWTQRFIFERASLSMGMRLDGSYQDAYMKERDYEAHERRDLLPEECVYDGSIAKCTTQYSGNAFVLGGIWQVVPEVFEVRGDISTGIRFPNVDERYLLGAAPTFPVYSMGDPNLPREEVQAATLTIGYRNTILTTEISGYTNWIDNYIYFAPWTVDGSLQNVTLINGSFPIYKFQSVDAHFYGLDGTVHICEDSRFATSISGATVRAWNRETSEHLIGIPADSIRIKSGWNGEHFSVQPNVSYTAKQHRVLSELDFAEPPEDYWLFNVQASLKHQVLDSEWTWNLNARNLMNTRYRRYTSLLRYYADEPGRDVQLSLSTIF